MIEELKRKLNSYKESKQYFVERKRINKKYIKLLKKAMKCKDDDEIEIYQKRFEIENKDTSSFIPFQWFVHFAKEFDIEREILCELRLGWSSMGLYNSLSLKAEVTPEVEIITEKKKCKIIEVIRSLGYSHSYKVRERLFKKITAKQIERLNRKENIEML